MSSSFLFFSRSICMIGMIVLLSSTALARQSAPVQGEIMVSHISPEYNGAGDEFIVLFNATDHAIDMDGFEVKYITAGGSTAPAGRIFTTSAVIAPRCYFLLATRETVQVGTVQVLRDGSMTTGMAATGGQLVVRESAVQTNVLYAMAWGSVSVYAAGMTDAAPWSGDGMLKLTASGTTYDRSSFNAPNAAYSHLVAASVTEIPTSATAPLPVELISFDAEARNRSVELRWKTATEVDNSGWEVERRAIEQAANRLPLTAGGMPLAASGWQSIGFVKGAGTSTSAREYSFTDAIPKSEINNPHFRYAYRLKQLDRSGTFSYSLEIEVEVGSAPKAFVLGEAYPNPFNPETTLEFTLADADRVLLRIYDVLGRETATLFHGIAEAGELIRVQWNASNVPSGIYYARLESGQKFAARKLVYVR